MASRDPVSGKFTRGGDKMVKKADADAVASHPEQFHLPAKADMTGDDRLTKAPTTQTVAEQYPTTSLSAYDPMDREVAVKASLVQDKEGNTPYGKLTFDDKLVGYIARKTEAARKAAFQTWFAQNFDRLDEGRKKVARELYSQFYKEREETLEQNLDTLKKLALIKIWGIRTREDLALKYAADSGLIDTGYLNNLLHPEQSVSAAAAQARYKRGILNPGTTVDLGKDDDARRITPSLSGRFKPAIFQGTELNTGGGRGSHVAYLKALGVLKE